MINAYASGILRHRFWGEYSALIGLRFRTEHEAREALRRMGKRWRIVDKPPQLTLYWVGPSGEPLDAIVDQLGSFGADTDAIASIAKSIDYGEPFEIVVPDITPEGQLPLKFPRRRARVSRNATDRSTPNAAD